MMPPEPARRLCVSGVAPRVCLHVLVDMSVDLLSQLRAVRVS